MASVININGSEAAISASESTLNNENSSISRMCGKPSNGNQLSAGQRIEEAYQ